MFAKFWKFIVGAENDKHIVPLPAERGKGYTYKGNEFIHHTDLHHFETAMFNLVRHQKIVLVGLVALFVGALFLNWHLTLVIFFSTSTVIYFLGFLFDAFVVYRTFRFRPEIKVTSSEIEAASEHDWPMYTIFCPLYKEWQVVPQFVEAMQKLDYPKDKLQIMFLLEENDPETIAKIRDANLPPHFEIVVVPHSKPKTKPKAMNYGLNYVRGEYLVIYDAEDVPDSDQLKKAVLSFAKINKEVGQEVVCIQAKLNFYNPSQNILTRVFTAEYSLWFDLVLPGLQSISAPIPLGGTSNHFKTAILRELAGWDAFNVTEDCDLGMRLAKRGYRTAIVDSTTHEEANSDLLNWYRQRSRWIKGYIQTYFVHMRRPIVAFIGDGKKNGKGNLIMFQLIVGSKTLSLFINPIMWIATVCYFSFRTQIGPFIESLFPGPILYIGVFSLLFGNFLYLYYYMVGCAKRGYNGIIKYVFLVPFYWLAMSAAAWQAAYEIVVKPHYWAKTVHGLHIAGNSMKTQQSKTPELIVPESKVQKVSRAVRFTNMIKFLRTDAGLLVLSSVFANFLNFGFNAYLGRHLDLDDFGMITIMTTFVYALGLFTSALSTTATHEVSFFEGARPGSGTSFFRKTWMKVFLASSALCLLWALAMPAIANYFHISNLVLIAIFTPAIVFSALDSFNKGYLQGTWSFRQTALAVILETGAKFGLAVAFVTYQLDEYVSLAIPVSMFVAWAVSSVLTARIYHRASKANPELPEISPIQKKFPVGFYTASFVSGISVAAFLSSDVILAKHYLSPDDAGRYGLLSLVGKMIFFFGSLLNMFIMPIVSRAKGQGKSGKWEFGQILAGTAFLTLTSALALSIGDNFFLPLLFGSNAVSILPYVGRYAVAMTLFTLSSTIVTYELARKKYFFPAASLCMSFFLWFGIIRSHDSIYSFITIIAQVNMLFFGIIFIGHLYSEQLDYAFRNLRDIFLVVKRLPTAPVPSLGKMRILIFNWRDTKSVFAGGAETYVHALASRWVNDGHAVTLFTSNDGRLPMNGETDGVRIIRRGGFYATYVLASLYYLVHFRGKFDVIVDSENGIPFFTPLYAKEPVYCLVHHIHQDIFRKSLIYPLAVLACFLEKHLMPFVYRNCNFITVSDSSKHEMELLKVTQKEIQIVHPGIDTDFLTPGEKSPVPTVSYVGRLKEHKSVDILIKAFWYVLTAIPDARLIIAGDGEEEKQLKELVREFNMGKSVVFRGKVSEKEKREIMRESWVFVTPSFVEGWGITTIEANACGTPVIASDVPGLRDSVRDGETGLLVPYGRVDLFADAIHGVLANEDERATLSENSVAWAANFGWNKSSDKFINIVSNMNEGSALYQNTVIQSV